MMRRLLLILPFLVPALASAADDGRAAFHGTWGTVDQCNRAPIKPGGTVLAQPFEISAQWLKQGTLWCNLNWGPMQKRPTGLFTAAMAQCGEDSVRGYFVGMELKAGKLTLRWDFPRSSGPLSRCQR